MHRAHLPLCTDWPAEACHCDKQNKGQRAHFLYLEMTDHAASWTCFVGHCFV